MSTLDGHLEQISLCAASIADLPFSPSKVFTNALLYSQDITALIRDTEPHERALFSVHSAQAQSRDDEKAAVDRRTTAFGISETDGAVRGTRVVPLGPRRNTAVAAVLGKDLAEKIRKGGGSRPTGWGCGSSDGREKGEVNVEILLQGAEKLSNVYLIAGVPEKIASLKKRYERVKTSIEEYEACAAEQAAELKRMSVSRGFEDEIEDGDGTDNDGKGDDSQSAMANDGSTTVSDTPPHPLTVDEMRKNEEEIAELERKKRGLEERVTGMEKDLAGVLR